MYPGTQVHVKDAPSLKHVPPFKHGYELQAGRKSENITIMRLTAKMLAREFRLYMDFDMLTYPYVMDTSTNQSPYTA